MLSVADDINKNKLRKLWQEAQELILIFGKIVGTLNKKVIKKQITSQIFITHIFVKSL